MKDTRKDNIEIELKILISDETSFKAYLEEHTEFIKEEILEDIYFENPDYPFLYIDHNGLKNARKWLRIRKGDKGDFINFKEKVLNERKEISYIKEIETKVDSGNQVIQIFESLGFVESCHYKKIRKVYRTGNFEFDVDFIDALGMVVEIEYQGKIDLLEDGMDLIRNFLNEIGILEYTEIKTTYPEILWNGIDCYL